MLESLEKIGFYTLSDERCRTASVSSPMRRCELILGDKCNFKCPYCRGLREEFKGTMPLADAKKVIDLWARDGLVNVRFSGGEPTVYPNLLELVKYTASRGVKRIALSTNGSADLRYYLRLLDAGVNDISISLDACCSADGKRMAGGVEGAWERVVENIRELSKRVYVTVGIVLIEDTMPKAREIVEFAHGLGATDIRVVTAAQCNTLISALDGLNEEVLTAHPILKYRVERFRQGINMRGLTAEDNPHCPLVLDDSAVANGSHFPCIIYMRERGDPIGPMTEDYRLQRLRWYREHNCYEDPICRANCLDVCVAYNRRYRVFHPDKAI